MKLSGSKVLVSGGDGFVGSNLVEQLVKAGADVTAFILYNSQNKISNLDSLPYSIAAIRGKVKQIDKLYLVRQDHESRYLLSEPYECKDFIPVVSSIMGSNDVRQENN